MSEREPDRAGDSDADSTIGIDSPSLPGKADSEGWRRMHPLTPLLQGGLFLIIIVGVLIANLRDRFIDLFVGDMAEENGYDLIEVMVEEGLALIVIGGVLAVILLIVLFSWLSWRVHTYRVSAEAVENREGILFKKHRRAPLERIQSVNLQRPLLARFVGLTKIEVQTAGQGGKVELAYLGHRDAKTVREQILRSAARSQGQNSPGQNAPMQSVSGVGVSGRELRGQSAPEPEALIQPQPGAGEAGARPPGAESEGAHAGLAGGAAAIPVEPHAAVGYDGTLYGSPTGALEQRAQDFADFDIDPEARTTGALLKVPVGRLLGGIALSWEMLTLVVLVIAAIVGSFWQLALITALIPLVLVFGSIMFAQFNKGFNFTVSRGGGGVRTSAGLTATNTESIPFGRIHAIEAFQPIGWRPFGWWKMRITTAGGSVAQGGQNQSQNTVLPVGTEDDVLRVFETLLPGIGNEAHEVEGLREGLIGRGAGYLGGGPRSGAVLLFGRRRAGLRLELSSVRGGEEREGDAVAGGTIAGVAPGSPDEGANLRIRRGVFTRTFIVMPILRAQSVQLRRPLLHRGLGLASIQAHTVLGPVRVEMRGVELAAAEQLFDVLAETVVLVQSGEAAGKAPE